MVTNPLDAHGGRPASVTAVDGSIPAATLAPHRARRPLRRSGAVWSAVWLFSLADPLVQALHTTAPARRYGGVLVIAAFAAVFVGVFARLRALRQRGRRHTVIVIMASATVLLAFGIVLIGPRALGMGGFISVMAMFLLPSAAGWATMIAIIVASALLPVLVAGWRSQADLSLPAQILIASLAAWGISLVFQRNAQLASAQNEIARLAVVDERNRFARDLHDILGHSLTVVAVKAELAGRLVRLNPDRAEVEIADVERLAREALADVRAAVGGYREVSLAGELANARTALAAAGIDANLPPAVDHVPAQRRALFGWVIREGVTNVVRHSGAAHCTIGMGADWVEVSDDGRGPGTDGGAGGGGGGGGGGDRPPAPADGRARPAGHGLAGLRERVTSVGGTLSVARSTCGGFLLRADVPGQA